MMISPEYPKRLSNNMIAGSKEHEAEILYQQSLRAIAFHEYPKVIWIDNKEIVVKSRDEENKLTKKKAAK